MINLDFDDGSFQRTNIWECQFCNSVNESAEITGNICSHCDKPQDSLSSPLISFSAADYNFNSLLNSPQYNMVVSPTLQANIDQMSSNEIYNQDIQMSPISDGRNILKDNVQYSDNNLLRIPSPDEAIDKTYFYNTRSFTYPPNRPKSQLIPKLIVTQFFPFLAI